MFSTCIILFVITNVMSEDFYSFTVKDWQGNDLSLERYRGKVKILENFVLIGKLITFDDNLF